MQNPWHNGKQGDFKNNVFADSMKWFQNITNEVVSEYYHTIFKREFETMLSYLKIKGERSINSNKLQFSYYSFSFARKTFFFFFFGEESVGIKCTSTRLLIEMDVKSRVG